MTFAAVLLVAAALSLVVTPAARTIAERLGVVDRPGARKLHDRATARLGGLAVVVAAAGAVGAVAAAAPRVGASALDLGHGDLPSIVAGMALVCAIGLWDDVRGVSAGVKIGVEAVAAGLAMGSGILIDRVTLGGVTHHLGIVAVPVTLAWILVVTNAFNLIDGLDGLAAGLSVIAAATCAVILIARGHATEAVIVLALLGALVGFLPYNFHPASIFLGDAGSLVIGFVLAVTAITGWQKGATALAVGVPVLVFAVPLLDTATAIVRRVARRPEPTAPRRARLGRVFQPDQEHIHHRLVARGLSHRGAVLVLYGCALALSALALLTADLS